MVEKPHTKKQKDFFKHLAEGETPRQAAILAGYSEKSANNSAKQNTENYADYWDKLLHKNGVTDERIAQSLDEGLNAMKVVGYLNNHVKGTQKVSDEFVDVPDFLVRHKYLDTAIKLKGAYPAEKKDVVIKDRRVILDL